MDKQERLRFIFRLQNLITALYQLKYIKFVFVTDNSDALLKISSIEYDPLRTHKITRDSIKNEFESMEELLKLNKVDYVNSTAHCTTKGNEFWNDRVLVVFLGQFDSDMRVE